MRINAVSLLFAVVMYGCGSSGGGSGNPVVNKDPIPSNDYLVNNLSIKWEQKTIWEDGKTIQGGDFHPCNAEIIGGYVAVTNCLDSRVVSLKLSDGSFVATKDLGVGAFAYVDGDYLAAENNGVTTFYNGQLQSVPAPQSGAVLHENLFTNGAPRYLYTGSDVSVQSFMSNPDIIQYFGVQFSDSSLRVAAYNGQTGDYKEYKANGVLLTDGSVSSVDIVNAAVAEYQKSNSQDILSYQKDVQYLTNGTWLVQIHPGTSGMIENAYQYLYHADGSVNYLGNFIQSNIYYGLMENTIVMYSPTRLTGTEPHYFRQFSLSDGSLISDKTIDQATLPPVLYGQRHSVNGIVTTSDSYSSVVLLQ